MDSLITNFKANAHFKKSKSPTNSRLRSQILFPGSVRSIAKMLPAGEKHYQTAAKSGFFANGDALSKLAWLEFLSGRRRRSHGVLSEAADHQKGQAKALSLYYRGTILNLLGRYEQAQTSLDGALNERPDLILAQQEKGESLWQLGRKDEAIAAWTDVVQHNPNLPLANDELAGAMRSRGQLAAAIAYEKQADDSAPDNPFYHWTLGLRLKNLRMTELAEKHFQRAMSSIRSFRSRPN